FRMGILHALSSISTALLFSSRPEIAAGEFGDLLTSSGCANSASVVHQLRDGIPRVIRASGLTALEEKRTNRTLLVHEGPDERTELKLILKDGSDSESAVNLVQALLEKLQVLEKARQEAIRRTRLWQFDEPLPETNGVILSGHMREVMLYTQKVARTN